MPAPTRSMLLTVHDELVLEVPVDERDATETIVRDVMENVTELRVPLVVDVGFGPNWAIGEVDAVTPHRLMPVRWYSDAMRTVK